MLCCLPFFVQYLLILTDPGLQRSGTLLHWFVVVVLPILEDLFSILKVDILPVISDTFIPNFSRQLAFGNTQQINFPITTGLLVLRICH